MLEFENENRFPFILLVIRYSIRSGSAHQGQESQWYVYGGLDVADLSTLFTQSMRIRNSLTE